VAALVVLAGRLPGHAEPGGDFWPPDARADGVVNERREPGLCRFPGASRRRSIRSRTCGGDS
jgi:hypothetical protein